MTASEFAKLIEKSGWVFEREGKEAIKSISTPASQTSFQFHFIQKKI